MKNKQTRKTFIILFLKLLTSPVNEAWALSKSRENTGDITPLQLSQLKN